MGDLLDLDYWQRRNFVTGDNTEKPRGHDGTKNKSTTKTQIGKCLKESNSQKHKVEANKV